MTTIEKDRHAEMDMLEALMDRHGLGELLSIIVDICHRKSEHVRSNWQDEVGAKNWTHAARNIDRVAAMVRVD